MAVTSKYYGPHFQGLYAKEFDFLNDAIKCLLVTSVYVPDQDAHRYKSSVTNEVVGTGYTAGGVALTTKTVTYTGASNVLALDADDPTWTGSTITARTAVLYDGTPATDATRGLIAYFQSDTDVASTSGTFSVQFAAGGIATITVG